MKKIIPISLFVLIALFVVLAGRTNPQPPDLHGSCVFAVQDWHNPEYIEYPYCYQAPARILQKTANTDISPPIYQPTQVLVQIPVFTPKPPTVAPTQPPVIQPAPNPTQPPVVTPPPTQPPPPPPTEPPVAKAKCNNGSGNGSEGCSPGKGNNDETP